jgi:hypothetical protein
MANSTEKQINQRKQILDTYNDEHWAKKYGVSSTELKETKQIGIPARIIEANSKNKTLHV